MFSNPSDRSGIKSKRSCLRLRRRQESAERQTQARGESVDDLRVSTEDSSEPEVWIDDHFIRIIKKLVHSFIDAENQLYGLQNRKANLESFQSNGTVPSGLKISVVAKGQSAQNLQEKFNAITKEAEKQLLNATIEALVTEEQLAKERCQKEKTNIVSTIDSWRESFQSSDSSLNAEADEFVKSAKCFADNFYFECAATRASKRLTEKMKKAAKDAKRTEQMETEFKPDEQSIRDMVQRAVQKEVSKLSSVSPPSKTKPQRKNSKNRGNEQPRSKGRNQRRRDSSHDARNQRNSSPAPGPKQERRSRSKQRRTPSVRFTDSRSPSVSRRRPRQQSKNGKRRGNGPVK